MPLGDEEDFDEQDVKFRKMMYIIMSMIQTHTGD